MRRLIAPLALAAALSVASCSRPDPPKLTPEQASITSITPSGIGLSLTLDAYNPNSIALSTQSVKAKVTFDGKYNAGDVNVATPLSLPAGKHTKLEIPLTVKWNDLAGLIALGASNRDVPYQVEGTLTLGGDTLNVDVPFRISGIMTHAEIKRATLSSLPSLPGLP
jgi:LEA14-like dessication related protein